MAPPQVHALRGSKSQNEVESLGAVGILEYLERDPRPTFVIDMKPVTSTTKQKICAAYTNPAIATVHRGRLLDALVSKSTAVADREERDLEFLPFRDWLLSVPTSAQPFTYFGYSWLNVSVGNRWSVISGSPFSAATSTGNREKGPLLGSTTARAKVATFDWTDESPPSRMTAHAAWARSLDWAATPLGPMSTWSPQLRSAANLVMQDPRPAVIFYGPSLIMLYNEAYIELLGNFHPCMGNSARVALSSVWPQYFEPIIQRNLKGETVEQTNSPIHMVRSRFMEETYFSLQFIPILDVDGTTVGHYEPLIETVSLVPQVSLL